MLIWTLLFPTEKTFFGLLSCVPIHVNHKNPCTDNQSVKIKWHFFFQYWFSILIWLVTQRLKLSLYSANGPKTFINLRAVSWEVKIQTIFLKFFLLLYSWTLNIIGPFAKKLEYLLFSENVVMGQSSSMCPGLSVHTLLEHIHVLICQTEIAEWLLKNIRLLSYLWIAFSMDVCFVNSCLPGTFSPGTVGFCLIPTETTNTQVLSKIQVNLV